MQPKAPYSGRCYCGSSQLQASAEPIQVVYCHCRDCRRLSGAPVAAFASFEQDSLELSPKHDLPDFLGKGVERWFCPNCGTQLIAKYDYLPDQLFVPLGVLDQAELLRPSIHCHDESRLPWLKIDDCATRVSGSARKALNSGGTS